MIEVNESLTHVLGVMVPIVAIVGGLSLAFGIRYLKSKERMEMISRGMDVSSFKEIDMAEAMRKANKRSPLRSGLVALGVGAGLLISYSLCHSVFMGDDNEVIYFGVVALCVGLALIASHILEGKDSTEPKN